VIAFDDNSRFWSTWSIDLHAAVDFKLSSTQRDRELVSCEVISRVTLRNEETNRISAGVDRSIGERFAQ
jgi:hypothetical protein